MALFGGARDVSMFRGISRELMWDIIVQECALYKFRLEETNVNIYGEAAEEKYYEAPMLLNVLIDRQDQSSPCLLYTSPSPRDRQKSRMPSSA